MPSMPVLIFWQDTWDKNILNCPDKMTEFDNIEFCHFVIGDYRVIISFLEITLKSDSASPVRRGVFLRQKQLDNRHRMIYNTCYTTTII